MSQRGPMRGSYLQYGRHPPNFIDLTNKTIGALMILAKGASYCGSLYWKYKCLCCGKEGSISRSSVKKGKCPNCNATSITSERVA